MKILILYFEPSVMKMLEACLTAEGYSVTSTADASEAIKAIEDTSDSYLLIADNFHLSPGAQQAFTTLHNRPDLRNRVKIVGVSAMSQGAYEWIADNRIDDHLTMPFSLDHLLDVVRAHVGLPPD
jgi:CheY-like chemotaxis protein